MASVTLDYDKMLTQQHQIIPGDDGNGVKQYVEEQYTVDGKLPSTSVVGENNNTDTPIYPDAIEENGNETTSINRVTEWENSYIDTQIEKGEAILKEATVSVVVQDSNFDQQKQEDLIEMVSKAVNLGPESISVKNFDPNAGIQDVDTQPVSYTHLDVYKRQVNTLDKLEVLDSNGGTCLLYTSNKRWLIVPPENGLPAFQIKIVPFLYGFLQKVKEYHRGSRFFLQIKFAPVSVPERWAVPVVPVM